MKLTITSVESAIEALATRRCVLKMFGKIDQVIPYDLAIACMTIWVKNRRMLTSVGMKENKNKKGGC